MTQPARRKFRAVFISDLHIGARTFEADALLDFLQSIDTETLYLVGDIVDGWKMEKRWRWDDSCSRVISELPRLAAEGTKLIYIPGNHDETARIASPVQRGYFRRKFGITIRRQVVHETADRRRFLVLHGDEFDRQILRGFLSRWGDWIFDVFSGLTHKRFSLAKTLGRHGNMALCMLNNFEQAVYRMTQACAVDGLICGHTHIPALKYIKGTLYGNCGGWLRNIRTALVEYEDGRMELITWPAWVDPAQQLSLFSRDEDFQRPPHLLTDDLIALINRMWPAKDQESARSACKPTNAGKGCSITKTGTGFI